MDSDAAERLIDSIYKAGMTGYGWNHLLNALADSLRADGAWLAFVQPDLQRYKIIAPRSDPDVIGNYQRHWWQYDLTTAVTSKARVGQITSLTDTGRKRFLGSKFHNEFWRYSGQPAERLAANLFVQGSSRISLGVQPRAQSEELHPELINGVKVLIPHLSRAAEIHCAMQRLEIGREVAKMSPKETSMLVDHEARLVFADDDALLFIRNSEATQFTNGHLGLNQTNAQLRFRQLLSSCDFQSVNRLRGGTLLVRGESGNAVLRVEVMPFQSSNALLWGELSVIPDNTRLLVFSDLAQNRIDAITTVRELFKLTPAEASVALELLRGDKRSDVANRLGVKLSTVRTHMMRVFEKAGVNSRAELIILMVQAGIDQTAFM